MKFFKFIMYFCLLTKEMYINERERFPQRIHYTAKSHFIFQVRDKNSFNVSNFFYITFKNTHTQNINLLSFQERTL